MLLVVVVPALAPAWQEKTCEKALWNSGGHTGLPEEGGGDVFQEDVVRDLRLPKSTVSR